MLAIASGVLQVLVFPNPNLYWLCWIALAPLLVALLRTQQSDAIHLPDEMQAQLQPASPVQGFALGYVAGVIWWAGTCYWVYDTMHLYGGLSAPVALGILVLFCLYLAIYFGAFGLLIALLAGGDKRSGTRRALFVAPFLWVGLELARAQISGFPWDVLGTAQVNNVAMNRIATFTGVYGLSFEIALVNTVFAAAWVVARSKRKLILIEAIAVALLLQLMALIRLPAPPADHTALLVQANIPILQPSQWTPEYFQGTLHDLVRISVSAAERSSRKPELVIWPESPAPFYMDELQFQAAVAAVARGDHAYVIAGSIGGRTAGDTSESNEVYNSAALMSPDGKWTARYDKIHLVPFGEFVPFKSLLSFAGKLTRGVGEFERGAGREPLQAGTTKLGLFICYESVFPDEVREFARNGAQVFVNISNDGWYGDTGAIGQHFNQARMRAVESHRWLLRSTNTGITAAIDPYGQVVARAPRNLRTTLEAPYRLLTGTTFYTRHGDWFAYACAIISMGALLWRFRSPAGMVR